MVTTSPPKRLLQKIIDRKFKFISMFNPLTGAYVRTGILDDKGRDTGVDPFMASFPHLIDAYKARENKVKCVEE